MNYCTRLAVVISSNWFRAIPVAFYPDAINLKLYLLSYSKKDIKSSAKRGLFSVILVSL
jgi:hypothetical protein